MSGYFFDPCNINWQTPEGIEHLQYFILDIDQTGKIIDVLFKFAAKQPILLHRHKALNQTFVLQGEHWLYHADGQIKEIRPVGSYTVSPPNDEPHRESGGDREAVVFFSIRGSNGVLYQILDDDLNILAELGMQDFVLWQQKQGLNQTNDLEPECQR